MQGLFYALLALAALSRCFARTDVVTEPTPPGTGVHTEAFSATSCGNDEKADIENVGG